MKTKIKTKSKIYYAHSKLIYGTVQEQEELDYIKSKYPEAKIINPSDLGELKNFKKYLKIIGKCNMVVVSEIDGYVGKGVLSEIAQAFIKAIPIKVLRKVNNDFSLSEVIGIKIINQHDWRREYAQLITNL